MPKFIVDFEITGDIEVEAENREEAMRIVSEEISPETLLNNVLRFRVGEHYVMDV